MLDRNWKRVRATKKNKLCQFTVAAYKAWHTAPIKVKLDTHDEIAKQPLFNNMFVKVQNKSIEPTSAELAVASHRCIRLGDLITGAPDGRYRNRTAAELGVHFDINVATYVWQ